jgi:hypothetical protein
MTEIIILIVICIIIYYIFKPKLKRGSSTQITQLKPSATAKDTSDIKASVSIDTSSSSIFNNLDTCKVIPSEDGGWILNPESTFPVTIYGINQSVAEELKQILDNNWL